MKRHVLGFILPWLLIFSSQVLAVCSDSSGLLRGHYSLSAPAAGSMVLRIRQSQEDVIVDVRDKTTHLRFSHPGGAGIDHFVLLDNPVSSEPLDLCLFARYGYSTPGQFEVEVIPLTTFTAAEIALLRDMTDAAVLWAEDNTAARAQALTIYSDLVDRAESTQLQTTALLFEAMALMRSTEYTLALQRFENFFLLNPADPVLRYKTYWQRGEAYLRTNQPALAEADLQDAIGIIETELQGSLGEARRDLAEILLQTAEAFLARRDVASAAVQIMLASEIAGSEYRLLGKLYNLIGYKHITESQLPDKTLAQRRQSLSESVDVMLTGRYLSEAANDMKTLASLENNLGFVYDRLGEYRQALTHFRHILEVVDPQEDLLVYRFAYGNLGRIYQYIADYPRSESYYRQAISLAENSSGAISASRCPLGTTLRLNGNSQAALAEHELCLKQAEQTGNLATMVLARYEMGEDYLALGDEISAWPHIHWAQEQNPETLSDAIRVRILRRYADLLQRRGQEDEANAAISQAISLHSEQVSPVDLVENHAMAMHIAIQQSDTAEAERQGLQAIELIEKKYEELESERQGPAWGSRTHDVYVRLAEKYLHDYFLAGDETAVIKSFNVTERSRAASLRQQFSSRNAEVVINDSVAQAAGRAQIDTISRIANEHAIVAERSGDVISLPTNYYHHQDVLSLYRLQGLTTLPLPPAMTLADIQGGLQPQQAILYYLMAEEDSYVFTVTSDSLSVDRLPDSQGTALLIAEARELLSDASASPYQVLAQLSERLLAPVAALEDKQELLIVSHGSLHALPFSALPIPGSTGYEPLVSRFSLQLVPSMTAYLMDKPLNQRSGTANIAVFADPVFDESQLTQQLAALDASLSPISRSWTASLQRLPNTAIEAQNLAGLFSEERSILLTGAQASRANLAREDVRNASILHIATHGYFNAANDDNVGLGFSVIDEDGNPDSGFVTLPELFSYHFNNELVVISGCDTTMGRPLAGEGMMGLSRGFIAQGARHVVSTLWPVSDRASADFMAIFYRELLDLSNVAQALQAAQEEMQQNPSYRNPFYWAAYVLTSVSPDQTMQFPGAL